MESERNEVYERIPWETLETRQTDKKWIVYAVAGAITVGALAYSFARSQPTGPAVAGPPPEPVAAAVGTTQPNVTSPPTVTSPLVVAEADLYAVDVDSLKTIAAAHAEWAAMDYFSADSADHLMPADIPASIVPEDVAVFVDWVGATRVTEVDQLSYTVEVAVRSLVSDEDGVFTRQPTQLAVFDIAIDDAGAAYVTAPPQVRPAPSGSDVSMNLVEPPAEVRSLAESSYGPVVGGRQLPDGSWSLVVMMAGVDGIQRPTTVYP